MYKCKDRHNREVYSRCYGCNCPRKEDDIVDDLIDVAVTGLAIKGVVDIFSDDDSSNRSSSNSDSGSSFDGFGGGDFGGGGSGGDW